MSFLQYVGAAIGTALAAWVIARIITAAYFKSKRDHETQFTTRRKAP